MSSFSIGLRLHNCTYIILSVISYFWELPVYSMGKWDKYKKRHRTEWEAEPAFKGKVNYPYYVLAVLIVIVSVI